VRRSLARSPVCAAVTATHPAPLGAFLASFQLLLITVFGVARRLGWHEPDFRGLKASKSAEAGISTLGDDPGGSITPLGAQV